MGAQGSESLAAWGGPATVGGGGGGWQACAASSFFLLPAFPPPGTQARLTKAGEGVQGVEWPGLRMTQGPAVTKATLLPSNGGFPVTSPSNGIFSWALAGAWQLFLAQLQINLQLHFWLLEKMQGVYGAAGGRQWTSRQGRKLAMCHKVQAHRWARSESTWEQGGGCAGEGESEAVQAARKS